jgi:hypothetical protein
MMCSPQREPLPDDKIRQLLQEFQSSPSSYQPVSSSSPMPPTPPRAPSQPLASPPVTVDDASSHPPLEGKIPQYPNGDVKYCIKLDEVGAKANEACQVGWATRTKNHRGNRASNRCLGVYRCENFQCLFTQRPKTPRSQAKNAPVSKPKVEFCPLHKKPLVHQPCEATISFVKGDRIVTVQHSGWHDHLPPPPLRPSFEKRQEYKSLCLRYSDKSVKALQQGSARRPSALNIDPIYASHATATYHRKEAFAESAVAKPASAHTGLSSFVSLSNFQHGSKETPIVSFSVDHISYQDQFMRERLRERESSFQTDSIEGFIKDDRDEPQINVAVTSGYCSLLDRQIPLLVSVLLGKSKHHYAAHFLTLFQSLEMDSEIKNWSKDQPSGFPGNTSDFSEAERLGFETAVRGYCKLSGDVPIDFSEMYRCCSVHFKRALEWIARTTHIIPSDGSKSFKKMALELLEPQNGDEFQKKVNHIKTSFKNARNWLDWYLSRGKFIFPAVAHPKSSVLGKDTNAQESLGADIQRGAPKHVNILFFLNHFSRYIDLRKRQYEQASSGLRIHTTRDREKTKKRRQTQFHFGDGEPPPQVLKPPSPKRPAGSPAKRQGPGRPKGSSNKLPTFEPARNWSTFGIPWNFVHAGTSYVNTCPIDTALMTYYYQWRYDNLPLRSESSRLLQVLRMIDSEQYTEARLA